MKIYNTYYQKFYNVLSIAIITGSFMYLNNFPIYSRIMISLAIGSLAWSMLTIPYSLIKTWYEKQLKIMKKEN